MTDGIYDLAQSRMVGDVKFHEHAGIDPKTADRWREQHAHPFLGDIAAVLARSFGYKPEPATIHEEISPARAAELLANLDSLSDEEINALLEALDQ
jgi:hypothetical protein